MTKVRYENAGVLADGEQGDYIFVDDEKVGYCKRSQFGPGYYLQVFGSKWQNAPGARYAIELTARTDFTYCKSKKLLEQRLLKELADKKRVAQQG